MRDDTRNHWKMDNLGRPSEVGIIRLAASRTYKGDAVIDVRGTSSTIRAIDGGGTIICPIP